MRRVQRDFDDVVEVSDQLTVTGEVKQGAVVRTGGHLVVYGNVLGDIVLEEGAFLTVSGTFFGYFVNNAGMAVLSGVVGDSALAGIGNVVFGAESLIIGDDDNDVVKLHRDGTTEQLSGDVPENTSNIDGTHFLAWDRDLRTFRPITI